MKEIGFRVTAAEGGFMLTIVYESGVTTRHIRASTSGVAGKIQEILIEQMHDANGPGEQAVASEEK